MSRIWINLYQYPEPIRAHFGGVVCHFAVIAVAGNVRGAAARGWNFGTARLFVVYGDNYVEFPITPRCPPAASLRCCRTIAITSPKAAKWVWRGQSHPALPGKAFVWRGVEPLGEHAMCSCASLICSTTCSSSWRARLRTRHFPAHVFEAGAELRGVISLFRPMPPDDRAGHAVRGRSAVRGADRRGGKIGARGGRPFFRSPPPWPISIWTARLQQARRGARALGGAGEQADGQPHPNCVGDDGEQPSCAGCEARDRRWASTCCSKVPLALCPAELEPLVEMARGAGLVYQKLASTTAFIPPCSARSLYYRRNTIGRLLHGSARHGQGGRLGLENEWRARPEVSGGGELLDQGVHLIDSARWFFDGDIAGRGSGVAHGFLANRSARRSRAWRRLDFTTGTRFSLEVSLTQWKNLFLHHLELVKSVAPIAIEGLGSSYGTERLTFDLEAERVLAFQRSKRRSSPTSTSAGARNGRRWSCRSATAANRADPAADAPGLPARDRACSAGAVRLSEDGRAMNRRAVLHRPRRGAVRAVPSEALRLRSTTLKEFIFLERR